MSSIFIPVASKTFLVAGIGPSNIATGSEPATDIPMILALGLSPSFLRPFSLQIMMQEAPSAIYDASPAVMKPFFSPLD